MDSQPSDACLHAGLLRESILAADWHAADRLAGGFSAIAIPQTAEECGRYLKALRETLNLAKASRSVAQASLARVRAAASFHAAFDSPATQRQNPVDPAKPCHDSATANRLPSKS
jgi:hypothetical protein